MESDHDGKIDIGHAVTVSEIEAVFTPDVIADPFQPASGERLFTGIHQRDFPVFGIALIHLHFIMFHVESYIGHMQKIVGEIFLNDSTLVSKADDEIIYAMRGIHFHDVPEDRFYAYFDHRLRFEVGFLVNSVPKAACKNNCLHVMTPFSMVTCTTPGHR
jgi:hypothetical protein